MPVISVTVVSKPKKFHRCEVCQKPISGRHLRLYGMAEEGDPPYAIRECLSCADKSCDKKVIATLKEFFSEKK